MGTRNFGKYERETHGRRTMDGLNHKIKGVNRQGEKFSTYPTIDVKLGISGCRVGTRTRTDVTVTLV